MVDLVTAYSNRLDLANKLVKTMQRLRRAQERETETPVSVCSTGRSDRPWRVSDRLSETDRRMLIAAFTDGTPSWKLAERYGISGSSVKRLVRTHRKQVVLTGKPHPPQDDQASR